MQCHNCRTELPPTARFCPTCGVTRSAAPEAADPLTTAPTQPGATVSVGPPPRRSVAPLVMTLVVLVALIGGGFVVVSSRDTSEGPGDGGSAGETVPGVASTTTPGSTTSPPGPTTTTENPTETTSETTDLTTTAPPPEPNALALDDLVITVNADRPTVEAHLDRWVPQISAKRDGLEWEGVAYDYSRILGLHRELDDRYGALLVSGGEFVFRIDDRPMDGWFITIVDQSHPTPEGALDWCRANSIDRNNCAAKLITNDQLVDQTLVLQ